MAFVEFSFENLLYMLLYALFSGAQMQSIQYLEIYPQMLFIFLDSFALMFTVIIEDISIRMNKDRRISKKREKKDSERRIFFKRQTITLIKPLEFSEEKKYLIFFFIILLGILTSIISCLTYIVFIMLIAGYSGSYFVLNLLFTWLLLWLLSNTKMHRHHVLALILLCVGLVIEIILNLDWLPNFLMLVENEYWRLGLILIGIILSISTREVIEKYTLDLLYIKHFRLLFYEGVGSLCFNALLFGSVQLIECEAGISGSITSFCYNAKVDIMLQSTIQCYNFSSKETIYAWLYLVSTFSFNIFRLLINKKHGPTHRYTGDIIAFTIFMLFEILLPYLHDDEVFNWTGLASMIILLIGCLIYNENIRINLCQLSINTRHEISNRASLDSTMDENDIIVFNRVYEDSHRSSIGDASLSKSFNDESDTSIKIHV